MDSIKLHNCKEGRELKERLTTNKKKKDDDERLYAWFHVTVFPDDSAWRAVKPYKSITVSWQINQNDSRVNSLKVWQQPERGSTMINSRKVAHGLLEMYIMPSPSNFPVHWQRILPRKCSRLKRNRETLMGNRENRPLLSPFDQNEVLLWSVTWSNDVKREISKKFQHNFRTID